MIKHYTTDRCYIIAEIGGNFTTLQQAKRLIDAAHACGVDAVKLQTYRADTITSTKAIFDMENTGVVSQHDLFRKYEVNEALHLNIFKIRRVHGAGLVFHAFALHRCRVTGEMRSWRPQDRLGRCCKSPLSALCRAHWKAHSAFNGDVHAGRGERVGGRNFVGRQRKADTISLHH